MKTIEFMGVGYQVEDWVDWIAIDLKGYVRGFEFEPMLLNDRWVNYDGTKAMILYPFNVCVCKRQI